MYGHIRYMYSILSRETYGHIRCMYGISSREYGGRVVFSSGKCLHVRSYMVYIYGSGQSLNVWLV
jgi:hypothetical protein